MIPEKMGQEGIYVLAEMERVYAAFATRMIEILDRQERVEDTLTDLRGSVLQASAFRAEDASGDRPASTRDHSDLERAMGSLKDVMKRHAVDISELRKETAGLSERLDRIEALLVDGAKERP